MAVIPLQTLRGVTSGWVPKAAMELSGHLTNGSSSFRGFAPPPDAACGGAAEPGVMRLYISVRNSLELSLQFCSLRTTMHP